MADGAQRIADFMGNAGCESSEGGELELLGLLGDLRDVLGNTRVSSLLPCCRAAKLGCSVGPPGWP